MKLVNGIMFLIRLKYLSLEQRKLIFTIKDKVIVNMLIMLFWTNKNF